MVPVDRQPARRYLPAVPNILMYGDTERSPALRHEIPIAIGDAFLYLELDGRTIVLTNLLERDRIARVLPDADLLAVEELGQSRADRARDRPRPR